MNTVSLTGRLTALPELRRTQSGTAVCSFTLAVKRPFSKDNSDFINCVVWRQGAEYLTNYGLKGNLVGVTGIITSRKYEDKNGNQRTVHEVICNSVEILQSKSASQEDNSSEEFEKPYQDFEELDEDDGDLPF